MSTQIHSILFDKKKYTTTMARDWLKKHNFKQRVKVQVSDIYLRYNITKEKKNGKYRTIDFGKNIRAVIEIKTGGKASTKLQAILFKKNKFTTNQAKTWLKKHNYKQIKPVDVTKNYRRFRLTVPKKNKMYRIISFNEHIKAVIEIL